MINQSHKIGASIGVEIWQDNKGMCENISMHLHFGHIRRINKIERQDFIADIADAFMADIADDADVLSDRFFDCPVQRLAVGLSFKRFDSRSDHLHCKGFTSIPFCNYIANRVGRMMRKVSDHCEFNDLSLHRLQPQQFLDVLIQTQNACILRHYTPLPSNAYLLRTNENASRIIAETIANTAEEKSC